MYSSKVLNENLHTGIIKYMQDCYCYNCDIEKS